MTISTITISAVNYISYASLVEANEYLAVDPVRAVTWAALSDDEKGAKLVAATRRLNLLMWLAAKTGTDTAQPDKWPRTGMVYDDGSAVSTSEVPQAVEDATILLAGTIAIDAEASESGTSGSNVKKVSAGTADVTFFRATSGVPLEDESAYALIKEWLENTASLTSSVYSGDDGCETFDDIDQWGLSRGYP